MTGIGEALLRQRADRRHRHRRRCAAPDAPIGQVHGLANAAILRPICKAVIEVQHQAQIPGAIHQAFQIARSGEPGPVGVVIPFTFCNEVWDYDGPVPPALPVALRRGGLPPGARPLCATAGSASASTRGWAAWTPGPSLAAVAEMLQAPVATSVSGKGAIPDCHPLAVGWGYGKQGHARGREGVQGRRSRPRRRRAVQRGLDRELRDPEARQLIHVDANPNNLGRNVPAVRERLRRFAGSSSTACSPTPPAIRRPACPPLWAAASSDVRAARPPRKLARSEITCGVDPMVFLSTCAACLGPDELIFVDVTASTHWASEAIEVNGPRRYFTPANNQSMGWAVPAADRWTGSRDLGRRRVGSGAWRRGCERGDRRGDRLAGWGVAGRGDGLAGPPVIPSEARDLLRGHRTAVR